MRQLRTAAVVAVALVLIGAGTAHAAGILYTASLNRVNRDFTCSVVNVSTRDVTLTIEAINSIGNAELSAPDVVVEPGRTISWFVISNVGTGLLHCKFIVTVGNRLLLRASACVRDADGLTSQACADAR